MAKHLTETDKVTIAITTANGASGSTAINGVGLDMAGFDAVTCIVAMGPITASGVQSLKWQQSDDDGSSDDYSDIEGTNQAIADDDDNQVFLSSLYRPTKRYVRIVVSRATQASTVGSAIYVQRGRTKPASHGTNVNAAEVFASPAEGTA